MKITQIKNAEGKAVGARYEHSERELEEINCPRCKAMLFDAGKIKEVTSFLESKGYSRDQISQALEFCEAYCNGQARECQIKSVSQGGDVDEDVDAGLLVAVIKEIGKASTNTVKMAQEIRESIKDLENDKHDFQNALFETEQTAKRALGKMELTVEQRASELSEDLHGRLDLIETNMRGRVSPVPASAPSTHVAGKTFFPTQYEKTGTFNPNINHDPYKNFNLPIIVNGVNGVTGVNVNAKTVSIGMPGS